MAQNSGWLHLAGQGAAHTHLSCQPPSPCSQGGHPAPSEGCSQDRVMPRTKQPSPPHHARGAHLAPAGGTDGLGSILQVTGQAHCPPHHRLDEVHRVEEGGEGLWRKAGGCGTGWERTLSPRAAALSGAVGTSNCSCGAGDLALLPGGRGPPPSQQPGHHPAPCQNLR